MGCGLGATLGRLAMNEGLTAFGIDRSARLLDEGKRRRPGLRLIQGEAERLPLLDRCLAGVLCECMLSLAADPETVLGEFARVIELGGFLALTDVYARQAKGVPGLRRLAVNCCIRGAMARDRIEGFVSAGGFHILAFEDHSRLLTVLAARIVFEYGSLAAFWNAAGGGPEGTSIQPDVLQAKPGYYLLVARRKEPTFG
jgi:SAM-dependent methyltransferase